jgi:glycerol-3-phosphate O-acyltransferase / dihydroxyacetone phosphate acyltransferase
MADLYAPIRALASLLMRAFFRKVEVTGLEHLPRDGGGVIVSWHPNGMIDPALIFTQLPRRVVFGARHGLFAVPMLGWLMRRIGTVPIYRAMDRAPGAGVDPRAHNDQSLDALANAVAGGGFSCLFPEGDSHDAPHLLALKTGAARFWYRARQLQPPGTPAPVIIPVGLHYDDKDAFRSNVLVAFHPPLRLPAELDAVPPPDEPPDTGRERCRQLTGMLDRALHEVVHATENWELHHLMHRTRKLVRAERAHRAGAQLGPTDMVERQVGFARVWAGYYALRDREPAQVEAMLARIRAYDADLAALGLEDHELDRAPALARPGLIALLLLQVVGVYLLLPPLLVFGVALNAPTYLVVRAIAWGAARRVKDVASVKLLVGALLFPLTWAGAAFGAVLLHRHLVALFPALPDTPGLAALSVVLLAVGGGAVSLRYLRLARETRRAVGVRLTRARRRVTLARLRVDRAELTDALEALTADLVLPGSVDAEGRVHARP